MKDSKFKNAYLQIIKQDWDGINQGGEIAPVTPEMPAGDVAVSVDGEDTPAMKSVTFTTADQGLIDALTNGFDQVTFSITTKDEATGEENTQEVQFAADAFGPFEVVDAAEDKEGDVSAEEGDDTEGQVETECGDGVPADDTDNEEDDPEGEGEVTNEDDDGGDAGDDGGDVGGDAGGDEGGDVSGEDVEEESTELEEDQEVDPSEWLEDGVCVKCGKEDCDGSCKCPKCGSVNCIGDCQ